MQVVRSMVACQQLLLVAVAIKMELAAPRAAQQGAWLGALDGRFSQLKVRVGYITMRGR